MGAVAPDILAFRLIFKRPRPVLADDFELPTKKDVDTRLLGGSALFGVGWACCSGFVPAAVAAPATGLTPVFAFVMAMITGIAIYKWIF